MVSTMNSFYMISQEINKLCEHKTTKVELFNTILVCMKHISEDNKEELKAYFDNDFDDLSNRDALIKSVARGDKTKNIYGSINKL